MSRTVLFPYKIGSIGAKNLARELTIRRVFANGKYRIRNKDVIINWGNSNSPIWYPGRNQHLLLNNFFAVSIAANKLKTFLKFKDSNVVHPEWTTDKQIAEQWSREGSIIVERHLLNASGGKGIIIKQPGEELNFAPLYTKYFKKKHEYRVHVFDGKVIDFAIKKKRKGFENANRQVRNYANGWIFCRENIVLPEKIASAAISAVQALGLDFGAVDIGHNLHYDTCSCFEVNTAPGIEGTTVKKYAKAIYGEQ